MSNSLEFSQNDYVVYPSHGVGKIEAIEKDSIAGFEMEMFVIHFEKDKMTLRVPTSKADAVGMRRISRAAFQWCHILIRPAVKLTPLRT